MLRWISNIACEGSRRFSCASRNRNLQLRPKHGKPTKVTGESVLKNQTSWTKWSCLAHGFDDPSRAPAFFKQLDLASLPGPDYLVRGFNDYATERMDGIADLNDAERCLRLLLQLPPISMTADEAIEYTWHGLRHTMVTLGTQLQLGELRCARRFWQLEEIW